MALGIPTDQRSQIMLLLAIAAAAGGYFFWTKVHVPTNTRITSATVEIDSLQAIVAKAKADLQSGTAEDLRRKLSEYRSALGLMRRLVPERNEVPSLIDDISTKAKVRGVNLAQIQPLAREQGMPFDIDRYRVAVYGHYDQVGEFLADVASLPRIVVPQELVLRTAPQQTQRLLADTLGALLEAQFSIRTYVKSPGPPPKPAGRGTGAR